MSAGLTPPTLLAWPMVCGLTCKKMKLHFRNMSQSRGLQDLPLNTIIGIIASYMEELDKKNTTNTRIAYNTYARCLASLYKLKYLQSDLSYRLPWLH